MMTVRDFDGNIISGCFTFDCCGFEVSCSTIAKPAEVMVFPKESRREALYRASSVEDAVKFCEAKQVVPCTTCKDGKIDYFGTMLKCPTCNGTGKKESGY